MADRIAEQGAIQYAVANPEADSKRAGLSGYIMGALQDWLKNPIPPLSRLAAPGRLRGQFFDSGIAPLVMNFADQNFYAKEGTVKSKSFSDIVTFSRTTNATVTNSAGLITYAPHNLLTFSEQFDNSAWSKTTTTVTANAIAAPDNATTADTLTANGANSTTLQTYTAVAQPYVFSVWIRRRTGTGTIEITADGSTYSTVAITSSWVRYETTVTPTAGSRTAGIRIVTSGDAIDVWGADLEIGSTATTYNSTTVKNLLGFTQEFDNAAWTKSNIAVTVNVAEAPNGTLSADQIQSTASNGTILESYTASGVTMTFSIWMRRITGTGNVDITMDTGVTWTTQAITTSWARYFITTTPASGARTAGVRLVTNGDVIQVFGAQVSPSASLDPYVYNPVAAPTAQAYYGPRFDYDPVTKQPKGLLIEEQRSNLLLNSAIAGTNLATQNVTVTAVAHTLSFYGTGNIVLSGAASATLTGTGAYPTRSTLTFTPTAGTLTLTVTGTVQYAQLEIGAFATSYIPTVASQVTRAADIAVIQGSNFSSWYNQNEGTLYAEITYTGQLIGSVSATNIIRIDDSTANNQIDWRTVRDVSPAADVVVLTNSNVQMDSSGLSPVIANTKYKRALAYAINNAIPCNNGILDGATDTSFIPPFSNRLTFGIGNDKSFYISNFSYYNTRLSNATLQAITS